MVVEDRPIFIEEEPEPDLRPPPELDLVTLYSNQSIKLTFNEAVQFLSEDQETIDYELSKNTLAIKITSGFDGSSYLAYSDRVEIVEEVKVEEVRPLTQEEIDALEK